jgi:hypothetical protein
MIKNVESMIRKSLITLEIDKKAIWTKRLGRVF